MQCIYFRNTTCYANPPIQVLAGKYDPEEDAVKKYCKTESFRSCPRLQATLDYFKAMQGK